MGKFFVIKSKGGNLRKNMPLALINTLYSITGSDIQDGSLRYWFFRLSAFPGYQETL